MNKLHVQWALDCLQGLGYELVGSSQELVKSMPWSHVVRFNTKSGYIFLKKTPMLIYEPAIIQVLQEQFNAPVPEVIARNDNLNCFLMKDAGEHLRVLLKKDFDVELACKAIDTFAALQVSTSTNIEALISAGVPDWRLDKLPGLYHALLLRHDILSADGLTQDKLRSLETLQSTVADLCQHIGNYGIPQTIVQPDFNDNNSLIEQKSRKITIIDLGELVISHPFFSMHNWLQIMEKHHSIYEKDKVYNMMLDTYLQHFETYATKSELRELFNMIRPLCHIYGALALLRLIEACGVDEILPLQRGKLCNTLISYLKLYG